MEDKPMFSTAQAGRASEDIVLQIEAAIINGRIKPGEKLPSERELQIQFGTGRGVIREALRVLKQKDLIEIKKGARGGAFIKNIEMANVSESLALFLKQNSISPEYTIEFRESIDHSITSLAVARGSAEEKNLLVKIAAELEETSQNNDATLEEIIEKDRELNLILVKMTGNPVFEWIMRALQQGFSSYDHALYSDTEFRKKTAANWNRTAREIERGETLRALSYINNHYILLRECIESSKEDNLIKEADFLTEHHH